MDEKPEFDRTSKEVKTSDSIKGKDTEHQIPGYFPRSDAEYNVTFKTWCVVFVSGRLLWTVEWLITPVDLGHVLWYQLLDRSLAECMPCCCRC